MTPSGVKNLRLHTLCDSGPKCGPSTKNQAQTLRSSHIGFTQHGNSTHRISASHAPLAARFRSAPAAVCCTPFDGDPRSATSGLMAPASAIATWFSAAPWRSNAACRRISCRYITKNSQQKAIKSHHIVRMHMMRPRPQAHRQCSAHNWRPSSGVPPQQSPAPPSTEIPAARRAA